MQCLRGRHVCVGSTVSVTMIISVVFIGPITEVIDDAINDSKSEKKRSSMTVTASQLYSTRKYLENYFR